MLFALNKLTVAGICIIVIAFIFKQTAVLNYIVDVIVSVNNTILCEYEFTCFVKRICSSGKQVVGYVNVMIFALYELTVTGISIVVGAFVFKQTAILDCIVDIVVSVDNTVSENNSAFFVEGIVLSCKQAVVDINIIFLANDELTISGICVIVCAFVFKQAAVLNITVDYVIFSGLIGCQTGI